MQFIGDLILMNADQGSIEDRKILLQNGMTTIKKEVVFEWCHGRHDGIR